MSKIYVFRAAVGALVSVFVTVTIDAALAAPQDYRFEMVKSESVGKGKTDIAIRLVHASDSKPVSDAVIFESKTDMGPSSMAEMSGKVTPAPASTDGLYHFITQVGMAGKWALHLAAKVQGEPETVRGTINFDAK